MTRKDKRKGLAEKKNQTYITWNFSTIELKYFDIFFVDPILKSDKISDLTVKNSNLYKLEFTITLP